MARFIKQRPAGEPGAGAAGSATAKTTTTTRRRTLVATSVGLTAVLLAFGGGWAPATAGPMTMGHGSPGVPDLPLGPPGTTQTSQSQRLEPGVTLTKVTRGAVSAATRWVVELSIPAGSTSPDPDAPPRSVQDEATASALVEQLKVAGFDAVAQPVRQVGAIDVPDGVIGDRVRLAATYATQAEANTAVAALTAAGFTSRSWYAGWDGESQGAGRWNIDVLTIDPEKFRGRLGLTYGPDLEQRETPTALEAFTRSRATVNAGFFVLDPAAGAPGDPAGVGVYDGVLQSETIAGRPAVVIRDDGRGTRVVRPVWSGALVAGQHWMKLDGINRVPGLIRNCGGVGDTPTDLPLHDVTCTDADELVAFTSAFAATTPSGAGAEIVLSRDGRVIRIANVRGTSLKTGQRSVQATGALATRLLAAAKSHKVRLQLALVDQRGATLVRPRASVVNGGPQLVRDGQLYVTQRRDGMVHPDDPSFQYGWVLQRNPRTFIGVDRSGRTVIVTIDGRQVDALGTSILETAKVAKALGLTQAMNLDGGGSTAMAVGGALVGSPSDAAGERPVGDAIFVR